MNDDDVSPCLRHMYHLFVCTTLVLLLGFQAYNYFWEAEDLDTDVSDVKYVVMQLTRGLSEVFRILFLYGYFNLHKLKLNKLLGPN